jgi:hypothetical protein
MNEEIETENPKQTWVFERSSGFAGWRCSKCATWIYMDDEKICQCTGCTKCTKHSPTH